MNLGNFSSDSIIYLRIIMVIEYNQEVEMVVTWVSIMVIMVNVPYILEPSLFLIMVVSSQEVVAVEEVTTPTIHIMYNKQITCQKGSTCNRETPVTNNTNGGGGGGGAGYPNSNGGGNGYKMVSSTQVDSRW